MQKIDNIEIKNFKSIRHQKIEGCKRVNVFVGPPNVGKSNILEALSLLTFIRQKRPVGLGELIRFERLSQLFNYSNIKEQVEILFNDFYSLYLDYLDEERVSLSLRDSRNESPFLISNYSNIYLGKGSLHSGQTNGIDDFSGFHNELNDLNVKPYKFISGNYYNKSLKYSALELKIPNGDNLSEVFVQNPELFKYFSDLLSVYNIKLYNDNYEIKLELNNIPTLYPLSVLADTLIRLIFFKTAVFSSTDSVLLFEEPESHLYEPYILEITNSIKYDKNSNQYFIVTHNQYFVEELLRDEESRNDTNIYLVGAEKGETKIKLLSPEVSKDVYQTGLNIFFNYQSLWDEN